MQKMHLGGSIVNSQTPPVGIQTGTGTELIREWTNPSVVVAMVLMLVGGNAVQEALAQSTGKVWMPVCFSFGWVSYTLSNLKKSLGDGGLHPLPDYPVKLFNMTSGYCRVNQNWLIGRIVRDNQSWISKVFPLYHREIRIVIFEAVPITEAKQLPLQEDTRHLFGAVVVIVQIIIAAIPVILTQGQEWHILAITGFGTLLAVIMGSLPQWQDEKIPSQRSSNKVFALTAGNGSSDVIIIKGKGCCLDLEELSTLDSPRSIALWAEMEEASPSSQILGDSNAKAIMGRPRRFLVTRCVAIFEAFGCLLILISLAGVRSHTWYLIAVNAIGWMYNAMVAGLRRDPSTRNLPLRLLDTILASKIMDGLMDLEDTYEGCGEILLKEFLPRRLHPDEEEWWNTKREDRGRTRYDKERFEDIVRRLMPRSMLPRLKPHETYNSQPSETPQDPNPTNTEDQVVSTPITPKSKDRSTPVSSPSSSLQGKRRHRTGSLGTTERLSSVEVPSGGYRDSRNINVNITPSKGQSHGASPNDAGANSSTPVGINILDEPESPFWD